jgi:hypothetical protein
VHYCTRANEPLPLSTIPGSTIAPSASSDEVVDNSANEKMKSQAEVTAIVTEQRCETLGGQSKSEPKICLNVLQLKQSRPFFKPNALLLDWLAAIDPVMTQPRSRSP